MQLSSRVFPDSAVASKFTESKCAYLTTFGIASYFKLLIVANIKIEKNAVDEAMNPQLQTKQLDIHVRFWNEGEVCTRYLNSEFLDMPQQRTYMRG